MSHAAAVPAPAQESMWKQPKAVWAVAFASVIAFMGIGLVDPILAPIAEQLHASPSQVSLLFTSYLVVMAFAMLITGAVSSRIGAKKTLLLGLGIIVVGSFLAGSSSTINQIIGWRAIWGLGNALFVATALAAIVGAAGGSVARSILLYEAALGLGIAAGPLIGGLLGEISWRGPFFGVSVLMVVAMLVTGFLLPSTPKPDHHTSVLEPLRALRHGALRTVGITALLYNFGFFTLLAWTPFTLNMTAIQVGFIFFGWGLMLAISSVFVAPKLQTRFGTMNSVTGALFCFALVLAIMALATSSKPVVIVCVVVAGIFLGINNTLVTETVMKAAPVERPVASAAYSFVRFLGGSIAPYVAGKLGEKINPHAPFWLGAVMVLLAMGVLIVWRPLFAHIDEEPHHGALELDSIEEAELLTTADEM